MPAYDFSTPENRADLAQVMTPGEYNSRFEQWCTKQIVGKSGGHTIRRVFTGFGPLFAVGDTGKAFRDMYQASAYAARNPVK